MSEMYVWITARKYNIQKIPVEALKPVPPRRTPLSSQSLWDDCSLSASDHIICTYANPLHKDKDAGGTSGCALDNSESGDFLTSSLAVCLPNCAQASVPTSGHE